MPPQGTIKLISEITCGFIENCWKRKNKTTQEWRQRQWLAIHRSFKPKIFKLKLNQKQEFVEREKEKDVIGEWMHQAGIICYTLALWQHMTEAETISFTFCFSLMIVFKLIVVTTTGGISEICFEEVETWISFGKSTATSNLHQLTCSECERKNYLPTRKKKCC